MYKIIVATLTQLVKIIIQRTSRGWKPIIIVITIPVYICFKSSLYEEVKLCNYASYVLSYVLSLAIEQDEGCQLSFQGTQACSIIVMHKNWLPDLVFLEIGSFHR